MWSRLDILLQIIRRNGMITSFNFEKKAKKLSESRLCWSWRLVASFMAASLYLVEQSQADTNLFDLATSPAPEQVMVSDVYSGPYSWDIDQLLIALYVEQNVRAEVLLRIDTPLQRDLETLSEATSIRLFLGLWDDTEPSPNIFVLIGEREQILRRSGQLADRFGLESFAREIAVRYATDQSLCNSVVAYDDSGNILQAIITIEAELQTEYCLRRQLLVALGLLGDLPSGVNSILSVDQRNLEITPLDIDILRRLYTRNN